MNTKLLIVGANGFIGSFLKHKLIKENYTVHTITKDDLKIHKKKRTNLSIYSSIFIHNDYKIIYYCAGYSSQTNSNKRIFKKNNVSDLNDLFTAIINHKKKSTVVLLGSRQEYGIPQYVPVDEIHQTIPINEYGKSKLEASRLALHYFNKYDIPSVIYRISNVYGPQIMSNFNNYNVINFFLNKSLKNEDLIIYNSGSQIRDYLYIDDLILLLYLTINNKSLEGNIFNIGYGQGITFHQMVELIAHNSNSNIKYLSNENIHITSQEFNYVSNIKKITSLCNWKPAISPAEGIVTSLKALRGSIKDSNQT